MSVIATTGPECHARASLEALTRPSRIGNRSLAPLLPPAELSTFLQAAEKCLGSCSCSLVSYSLLECLPQAPLQLLIEGLLSSLVESISTRDCFAVRGDFMKRVAMGARLRNVHRELLVRGVFREDGFSHSIDARLLDLTRIWAESFNARTIPRPSNVQSLASFDALLEHYEEWLASIPLQLSVPQADVQTLLGFG